jgi:CelD/BcsL family acetyltransferase involved in cellulose biosynthesis
MASHAGEIIMHAMSETVDAIKAVIAQEPELTYYGFGIGDDKHWSEQKRQQRLIELRDHMLTARAQLEFRHACTYLAQFRQTKQVGRRAPTSYWLKHLAERTAPALPDSSLPVGPVDIRSWAGSSLALHHT